MRCDGDLCWALLLDEIGLSKEHTDGIRCRFMQSHRCADLIAVQWIEVVGFGWTGFNEINVVVYPFFPCF